MTEKEEYDGFIEAVTDAERDLGQNALSDYKKKNYISCLQHLHKLDNRSTDFKVAFNKAAVEYIKSDCRKTEAFEKSILNICAQFHIRLDKLDELDHSIAHYNLAILAFHRRQLTNSLRIMDKVYKFIEPMDDMLAKQVSYLVIELQLSVRNPTKALTLISYIENHVLSNAVAKNSKETEKKADEVDNHFKIKMSKYKARCHMMKHQLKLAQKEVQLLTQDKSNVDAMFMAANLEYLNGNFSDAMQILGQIPEDALIYGEQGESSTVMFYNNMGAIHHAMGKPNLACHYYQQALKEDLEIQRKLKTDNGESPVYAIGGSRYHELIYNLGIAFLHSGRAAQAFECLIIAARRYHRNSRLWMRIAECCIKIHKPTNHDDFDISKKQKELVVDVVGSKDKQKIILTTSLSKDKKYSSESHSYAVPVPSLEFASICLQNAYILLPSETVSAPIPLFIIPGVTPPAPTPSPGPAPSAPLTSEGIVVLKNGILVASSYVSLCLGDFVMALEHAKNLLSQPRISPVHKLLGHLYAGESLVLLDKITDAIQYLNPENIKDIGLELPEEENKSSESKVTKTNPPPNWFPDTLSSAHVVMQYNLAVAKTIRGQLDQAALLLKQIWQLKSPTCKVPAHIIMLVIYIELQLGHAEIARNLIKQYSFVHRISG